MRHTRPIVSVTFDDCPRSAVRLGAGALEARGLQGTFYVSGGLAGRAWENGPQFHAADVPDLVAAGHEIGCHTYSHLDCAVASRAMLARDLARNRSFLADAGHNAEQLTFAYPYGSAGLAAKAVVQGEYLACRGVERGINAGSADLGLLKSVAIPHQDESAAWVVPWIERIKACNGWLILCTHDVSDTPSPFGCTPKTLADTLDAIVAAGLEVQTVKAAALLLLAQRSSAV